MKDKFGQLNFVTTLCVQNYEGQTWTAIKKTTTTGYYYVHTFGEGSHIHHTQTSVL